MILLLENKWFYVIVGGVVVGVLFLIELSR